MAALKISDLSVGDWVSFDTAYLAIEGDDIATAFVKKVQQPARIKSILGDQDLIFAEVETEDDFGTIYLKIEHIRPSPITPEILEANGIHRTYEDDKYAIFRGDSLWAVKYSDGDWELSTPPVCRVDIKYIHQLQHALRLAGVDKEIVMPNK